MNVPLVTAPAKYRKLYLSSRRSSPQPSIRFVDFTDLQDGYPDIEESSFLATVLPRSLYVKLEQLATPQGNSLDTIIQVEVDHPTPNGHGILFPEVNSIGLFSDFVKSFSSKVYSLEEIKIATNLDAGRLSAAKFLKEKHFVSCFVSTHRSVAQFAMATTSSRGERRYLFDALAHALTISQSDYQGRTILFEEMDAKEKKEFLNCSCQLGPPDSPQCIAAGLAREWPEARGAWHGTYGTFTAHINTQEHLHLMHMFAVAQGHTLHSAFGDYLESVSELGLALQYHNLSFAHHSIFGHLNSSPYHLGADLSVELSLQFSTLSQHTLYKDIVKSPNLFPTANLSSDGSFTVSYDHHFGLSEVEFLNEVLQRAELLAEMESLYAEMDNIYSVLPADVKGARGKALANYPTFPDKGTTLARLLDQNTYLRLSPLATKHGCSLDQALEYGRQNPTDRFWFSLHDVDTLEVFGEVLLPVVKEAYKDASGPPPLSGLGPTHLNGARTLDEDLISYCYIKVQRNMAALPLAAHTRYDPVQINCTVSAVLAELKGIEFERMTLKYFSNNYRTHPLIKCNCISSSSGCGQVEVWLAKDLDLAIYTNTEEHVSLVFSHQSSDMLQVYQNLCFYYPKIETQFNSDSNSKFAFHPQFGFLSSLPKRFGLLMSCGVLISQTCCKMDALQMCFNPINVSVCSLSTGDLLLCSNTIFVDTEHTTVQRLVDAALRLSELEYLGGVVEGCGPLVEYHPNLPDLSAENTLLAEHLSPVMYSTLINKCTSKGYTLDMAIQVGVDEECSATPSSHPGIVAGDEECYDTFRELFHLVISECHGLPQGGAMEPNKNQLSPISPSFTDPAGLKQVKLKLHFNISSFAFPPSCTRAERNHLEQVVSAILKELPGVYHSLQNLPTELRNRLKNGGFLAMELAYPQYVSTNIMREWPTGRGVWLHKDGSVAAFVNGEDHIALTSVNQDGRLTAAYCSLLNSFSEIKSGIVSSGHALACHSLYGMLTTSPSNCGTGLHVECVLSLPSLSSHPLLGNLARTRQLSIVNVDQDLVTIATQQSCGVDSPDILSRLSTSINYLHQVEQHLAKGYCVHSSTFDIPLHSTSTDSSDDYPDVSLLPLPLSLSLTQERFNLLKCCQTSRGFTLEDVLAPGVTDPAHPVGVVACEAECYSVFGSLYTQVLYNMYPGVAWQPKYSKDLVSLQKMSSQFSCLAALSFEVRRNLASFPFPSSVSRVERTEVELILKSALSSTSLGRYVEGGSDSDGEHPLIKPSWCGLLKDWPNRRGVYVMHDNMSGYINLEDHLLLSITAKSSDIATEYKKMNDFLKSLEVNIQSEGHQFAFLPEYGYLTSCPSNAGSGVSVRLKLHLPRLTKHPQLLQLLKSVCLKMDKESEAVNDMTGEASSTLSVIHLPGYGTPIDQSLWQLTTALCQLSEIEQSIQVSKKSKWTPIPLPMF